MRDTEPVAHMIDVEPVLILNCSAGELKMCAVTSLIFWLCVFLLLFLIAGISVLKIILVPLISLFFASFSTYFLAKYIGKAKRGKPHLYYKHQFEMKVMSKFRKPFFMNHVGYFCIGRSPKKEVKIHVETE